MSETLNEIMAASVLRRGAAPTDEPVPTGAEVVAAIDENYRIRTGRPRVRGRVGPVQMSRALEAVRVRRATEAIQHRWDREQMWRTVGLPVGGRIAAEPAPEGGYQAHFRSGLMSVDVNGGVRSRQQTLVELRLAGLECLSKQESTDEVYGVVAVVGPANQHLADVRLPGGKGTISMGPAGTRLLPFDQLLYRGPIEDLYVLCTLVENDSGDPEAVARRIVEKVRQLAGSVLSVFGIPAEAVAQSQSFDEDLVTGLTFLLGDVFGIGDDPYTPVSRLIPWDEILGGVPRQPPARRPDDSRTIPRWTHSVEVTGVDDGDDVGRYRFYLDVQVEQINVTR